jgi:GNAT superfamily N-acetyltransferase
MTQTSRPRSNSEDTFLDLRDRPEFVGTVIEQNVAQWGAFTDIDRVGMARLFAIDNPRNTLPLTLIALHDDHYIGCVSLRERTMGMVTHPEAYLEASPWLSNMWVAPEARGRKLASRLTLALESCARALGICRIYSSTAVPNSLYHKLGYRDLERRAFKGGALYLIVKDLD